MLGRKLVFLPGAVGARDMWRPVAERLPAHWRKVLLNWPGAGDEPHNPGVASFEDLTDWAAGELDDGTDVIAHSMGGILAVGLALRYPTKVRRLVLQATSGGLQLDEFGASDWRSGYRREFPGAAPWVSRERVDFSSRLGDLAAPALLLWGDSDPISPVAVGQRLRQLLPNATLEIIPGATHAIASERPDEVASLIERHLS